MRQRTRRMTRMKSAAVVFATAALMSCSNSCSNTSAQRIPDARVPVVQIEHPGNTAEREAEQSERRRFTPAFNLEVRNGPVPEEYCTAYSSEIEQNAKAHNLDPILIRAFILVESDFDSCAAAKLCRGGYEGADCFQLGPAQDDGYDNGYDEMWDPSGTCNANIVNSSKNNPPDWRWLGLGVMQTVTPPHEFWPAKERSDGVDGAYSDIFLRSPLGKRLNLHPAKQCSSEFNPFKAADSICLGTTVLGAQIDLAYREIADLHSKGMLNWDSKDHAKNDDLAIYIAARSYEGSWHSSNRDTNGGVGSCPVAFSNGQCLTYGFFESWTINADYCGSDEGSTDEVRCTNGRPRMDPPEACFGYHDILDYAKDCFQPIVRTGSDIGERVLRFYYWLKNGCQR
ncbi:MAG: hypothetical protein ABH983_06275 [Candidatus Micrarchaeota archaeon]